MLKKICINCNQYEVRDVERHLADCFTVSQKMQDLSFIQPVFVILNITFVAVTSGVLLYSRLLAVADRTEISFPISILQLYVSGEENIPSLDAKISRKNKFSLTEYGNHQANSKYFG